MAVRFQILEWREEQGWGNVSWARRALTDRLVAGQVLTRQEAKHFVRSILERELSEFTLPASSLADSFRNVLESLGAHVEVRFE